MRAMHPSYPLRMKYMLSFVVMIGLSCSASDVANVATVNDCTEADAGYDADMEAAPPLPTATATQSMP